MPKRPRLASGGKSSPERTPTYTALSTSGQLCSCAIPRKMKLSGGVPKAIRIAKPGGLWCFLRGSLYRLGIYSDMMEVNSAAMNNGDQETGNERMDRVERMLERLTERHQALAESVESLTVSTRELAAAVEGNLETTRMLRNIADLHERRSNLQERRLDRQDREAEERRREHRELIGKLSELTARLPPPQANT